MDPFKVYHIRTQCDTIEFLIYNCKQSQRWDYENESIYPVDIFTKLLTNIFVLREHPLNLKGVGAMVVWVKNLCWQIRLKKKILSMKWAEQNILLALKKYCFCRKKYSVDT